MDLKNELIVYIGIVIVVILVLIRFRKKSGFNGGTKVANTAILMDEPYFKKRKREYRVYLISNMVLCILALLSSFVLIARPYTTVIKAKEDYNRDIILCMDASTSVDWLNMKLISKLKKTVGNLKGERIGIVIFNSSPVMLSPLTNDYSYVLNILDELEQSYLANRTGNIESDDWYYIAQYLYEGTLIGAEERGSSLIGDGLAGAALDFPNLDEKRTRIIIFSTDNEIQGEPIMSLDEAASLCKENNIIVYGIGTQSMATADMASMQSAVVKTGGKFYLEEDSGTVDQIVESIEKEEKNLSKGKTEIIIEEQPTITFVVLLITISAFMVISKKIKL